MIKTNHLAYYDQLTDLPNVYRFKDEVEERIREDQADGFILLFSIKSLASINSTLGYEVGNQILRKISLLFKDLIGKQGILAKTGGNEFAIWIDQLRETDYLTIFTDLINDLKVNENVLGQKLEFHSVAAKFVAGQETFDQCYQKVILTLTYAKYNNIESLLLYNDKLASLFKRKEKIKDLLEKAIRQNEISLHYQCQFNVKTNQVIGVEGLARWNSPELGNVPPNEFIPIIESMNLSTLFGDFIIDQVLSNFKKLQEKYHPDIGLSLNISPSHLIDPAIIGSIRKTLKRYHIPPGRITIEITEDILIQGIAQVKPVLKALRALKLRISLDDFGTGYSSLNYLSQLEIDELKIDKSFTDQIEKNKQIPLLIENIINLSNQLQINVIAEGVETKEQKDLLEELGCDVIQGYYHSKPEPL